MGMMTNDQIHAPVNAFSAKYLLIILRVSVFLDSPVTACQDQVHLLFPQRFDIILDQLFCLCAPFYLIDGDDPYFQILLSAVGCRTVRDLINTYIFIIGIDDSLLLQCRHRVPASLFAIIQAVIISEADGLNAPQCQQMCVGRISLDTVRLVFPHLLRCGQRSFQIHNGHIVRIKDVSHIFEKIALILCLIVGLSERRPVILLLMRSQCHIPCCGNCDRISVTCQSRGAF